jgi:tetratricopeptide (TPR) repeat protein
VIEQLLQADRLLAVDQVDAAEAIYRRVAELDPMDAIAVVGLARCALARGDDQRAHELAARALEIDPANDMARRMEARLSEILGTRGVPVSRPAAATSSGGMPMRPVTTSGATTAQRTATPPAAPIERRGLWDRLRGR